MTDLTVRRLLIDLEAPLPRHWAGGDAFRTACFNALSLSFPIGEQFFIDSLKNGLRAMPESERERFDAEVQGFVGQEATHRRIHELFNAHLLRQGDVNIIEPRVRKRLKRMEGWDPRHAVAITAATEHFTAILAQWLLNTSAIPADTEPRLRTMWLWHAAEETEHRNTAFDVYRALGGNEQWRRRWMRLVTWFFFADIALQTTRNLWRDGTLFRWKTWKSAARFFFGDEGLAPRTWPLWRAYFRADFHPSQHDPERARNWLAANASQFAVVSRTTR